MSFPAITGLAGIQTGMDNMRQDAHNVAAAVAKGDEDTTDLATSLVELNLDQRQVEASVKVVQAMDGVLGTLLDVKA
jgi:hypothetical protein